MRELKVLHFHLIMKINMKINTILAIITVFLAGFSFFFIFRSLFLELTKKGAITKKDGYFTLIATVLVLVVYMFLEKLHH